MTKTQLSQLHHIAQEFRKGILSGKPSKDMCFAVSSALGGFLSFSGYQCKLTEGYIENYEHCWLTLPDDTIIDATADQFQMPNNKPMPPIYVGKKPEWYKT